MREGLPLKSHKNLVDNQWTEYEVAKNERKETSRNDTDSVCMRNSGVVRSSDFEERESLDVQKRITFCNVIFVEIKLN